MILIPTILAITIIAAPSYYAGNSYATGGGEYAVGATATLTAYAIGGDVFSHWSSGSFVSYDNPITVVAEANRTYVANFIVERRQYNNDYEDKPHVTVSGFCGNRLVPGWISCSLFEEGRTDFYATRGSSATLTATPPDTNHFFIGWHYSEWTNNVVVRSNPLTFHVWRNTDIIGYFYDPETMSPSDTNKYTNAPSDWDDDDDPEDPKYYTVTTAVVGDGTATGGGVFAAGSTCTLTATPNGSSSENYFIGWAISGGAYLTATPYTFHVYGDQTWTAVFGNVHEIKVSSNYRIMNGYTYASGIVDPICCAWLSVIDKHGVNREPPYLLEANADYTYYLNHNAYDIFAFDKWEMSIVACGVAKWDYSQESKGCWYPKKATERYSKIVIQNPESISEWKSVNPEIAYSLHNWTITNGVMNADQDWYIEFIRIDGDILRNGSGVILRNDDDVILRNYGKLGE